MKILIVSDTHGRERNLERVLEIEKDFDYFIHLGDVEDGEDYIRALIGNVQLAMVAGNNDFYTDLPHEVVLELGKHRALITHGHYYYVSMGHDRLYQEALARGLDVVMYGHTHRPCLEQIHGVTILNPGSLTLPRQKGYRPSYIMMEIDPTGNTTYDIRYLEPDKISMFMKK